MSRRWVGLGIMLVGSLVLGVLSGHWYFRIFEVTVPAAVVTSFNKSAAYAYFLWRGALLGVVFFLWALAALVLARFFRERGNASPTS